MTERVNATRAELLLRRDRIRLARQGRDLLEDKRKELLRRLGQALEGAVGGREALERVAAEARRALQLAEALDGPERIASAAWATEGEVFLDARVVQVMGVRVPEITRTGVGRSLEERGYALGATTPRVDAAAERFEAEVDLALEQAVHELRLRRLADEVGKTTRRINALQHVIVPRLEDERARIAMALEEREREERFRLRRVRARRARGRAETS